MMDRGDRQYLKIRWPHLSATVTGLVVALFVFAFYAHYDARREAFPLPWPFVLPAMAESLGTGARRFQIAIVNFVLHPGMVSLDLFTKYFVTVFGPSRLAIESAVGLLAAGWSVGLLEEDRGGRAAVALAICAAAVGGVAALVLQQAGNPASPIAFGAFGSLLYTRREIGIPIGDRLLISGPAAHLMVAALSAALGMAYGGSYLFTIWLAWIAGAWLAHRWGDQVSIGTRTMDAPIPADGIVARGIALVAPQSRWSLAIEGMFMRGRDTSSRAVRSASAQARAVRNASARARAEAVARFVAWKDAAAKETAVSSKSYDALQCRGCGAAVAPTDLFCAGCGARTARPAVLRRRSRRGDKQAVATLCGVTAYFVLAGSVGFWVASEHSKEILQTGAQYAADEEIVLDSGDNVITGEWREEVKRQPYLVGIVYTVIVGLFLALSVWARWSPFAALCVGAALFASIVVLYIVLEPAAWHQGLYLRVVVAFALVTAIRRARSDLRHTVRAR